MRRLDARDWGLVLRIYSEGIVGGLATFDTETPTRSQLDARWLDGHRWVVEVDGTVAGWAALSPVSSRRVGGGREHRVHRTAPHGRLPDGRGAATPRADRRRLARQRAARAAPGHLTPRPPGDTVEECSPSSISPNWTHRPGGNGCGRSPITWGSSTSTGTALPGSCSIGYSPSPGSSSPCPTTPSSRSRC
ncbi:acetyltransferase [Rhodococcus opacus M213]|uniref:Acetyltransferase n=1 Tax=Rhodococcus opacus M213 TaxID=1129896 RepID=K8XQX6_RHOOP|nr:acetyltransferase [Rhodococcus opacus M213]